MARARQGALVEWLKGNGVYLSELSTWGRAAHPLRVESDTTEDFEPSGRGLLAQKDAYWVYEQASAESNLLALFWSVRLEEGKGDEDEAQWVPGEVQLVTQRDTRLPAQAGVAHELGVMYGIEYWRRRDMGR